MKYNYREGVEKPKSKKWVILPLLVLLGGVYALVNYLAPAVYYVTEPTDTTAKKLVAERPKRGENRLYIPKINADIMIALVEGDEAFAFEKGAVQRSSNSGDPKEGGNYVLTANRFSLGLTPMETKAKSPFYHLDKLSAGDDIYIDYQGIRYAYKVEERKAVEDVTQVEERTDEPQLTLYTTEAANRQVVIAKQIGKVVWTNSQPKLQPLPDS